MPLITYQEQEYTLFLSEYDLQPSQPGSSQYFGDQAGEISLKIDDYKLFLEERRGGFLTQEALNYSGGMLVVQKPVPAYAEYDDMFSYEIVLELIFKDGILMTTVDHSKAMLRVRRNLERGLRSMVRARDRYCIRKFMHKTVICDYRQSRIVRAKKKCLRGLHHMCDKVIHAKSSKE